MSDSTFTTVTAAALQLGLPVAWLRREADAGRVPSLRAGRRLLVDPQAVAESLRTRTASAAPAKGAR